MVTNNRVNKKSNKGAAKTAAKKKKSLKSAAKKVTSKKSIRSLKKENDALRATLNGVWDCLVDIGDGSSQDETLDAIDSACEIMAADWPEDFQIDDEPSLVSSSMEDELKELAERAAHTDDLNEKAVIVRKALALELGVDERQIGQQVEQMTPEEYVELAVTYFWFLTFMTAKLPMSYRKEVDKFIAALNTMKKSLPRKHGPASDPIISEALTLRESEGIPYSAIHSRLLSKYREQMISKGITPEILGKRVRSRRSRVKKSQGQ